jgi:hypothetical protein
MLNKSGAEAQVLSVVPGHDFVTSNDACSGVTLDAGKSCTVDVAFQPLVKGRIEKKLTVTTDSASSPQYIELSGVGASP